MAFEIILVLIAFIAVLLIGYYAGKYIQNRKWESRLKDIRGDAVKQSRAVLCGQFSEQLAPYLPGFPFSPTECRFIGKPVDFVVFKGMDEKNIKEVAFVEVKSGKSNLSQNEKSLKNAIDEKKVSWHEYRIPS